MLETCDRCGVPVPEAPPVGAPHACEPEPASARTALLAASPARERPRRWPRGLRLVIRCRTSRRRGGSWLGRLSRPAEPPRQAARPRFEAPPAEPRPEVPVGAPGGPLTAPPAEPAPHPAVEAGTPFQELESLELQVAADEAWNVDLFEDGEAERPCGELDGPLTWSPASEPQSEPEPEPEPEGAAPPPEAPEAAAGPSPVVGEVDQSLLLAELERTVAVEPPAETRGDAPRDPSPHESPPVSTGPEASRAAEPPPPTESAPEAASHFAAFRPLAPEASTGTGAQADSSLPPRRAAGSGHFATFRPLPAPTRAESATAAAPAVRPAESTPVRRPGRSTASTARGDFSAFRPSPMAAPPPAAPTEEPTARPGGAPAILRGGAASPEHTVFSFRSAEWKDPRPQPPPAPRSADRSDRARPAEEEPVPPAAGARELQARSRRGRAEAESCFQAVRSAGRPEPVARRRPARRADAHPLAELWPWLVPSVLPALLTWLAAPLAGALVTGTGLALAGPTRRPGRLGRRLATALGVGGLALSLAAGALAAVHPMPLPLAGLEWSWPAGLLAPGALLGLAGAATIGLRVPGRAAARLAAVAGPCAGALGVLLAGASPAAALVAGGALTGAALACSARLHGWRLAPQRLHLRSWSLAGVGAVAAALVSLAFGQPATPAWALVLALAPASAAAAARAHALEEREWTRALLLGAAALLGLATTAILLGRAAGLDPAACLALALVAPVGVQVARWRRVRAWNSASAPSRALRLLAHGGTLLLAAAVGLALLLLHPPAAGSTLAATLLILAAACSLERGLGGAAGHVVAATTLVGGAFAAAAWAAGLAPAWSPAIIALVLSFPLAAGDRLPGRTRRSDWERPVLALGTLAAIASLPACVTSPAAGLAGVLAGCLAVLPLVRRSPRVRAATPALVGLLAVGLSLTLGRGEWSAALLAAAALGGWALARRLRELLVGAGAAALAAGLLALPLAVVGHWQASVAALALLGLLGAIDFSAGGRRSRLAAALAVGGWGGAVSVGAAAALAGPALPFALVLASVILQGLDAVTHDGRLSRCLQPSATIAWLAGLAAALPQAAADPAGGAALLGAAAAGALALALLRRDRWPAYAAGLCAAGASGLACAAAGWEPTQAPLLFLAPAAAWTLAWGVFESVEGREPNAFLTGGLGLLSSGVLLQVHATEAPTAWRLAAITFGLAVIVAGALTRHKVPVVTGALLLLFEGLLVASDLVGLAAGRPGPTALALLGTAAAIGGALLALSRRAGGTAPLRMAWQGHWLRAAAEWSRWR